MEEGAGTHQSGKTSTCQAGAEGILPSWESLVSLRIQHKEKILLDVHVQVLNACDAD